MIPTPRGADKSRRRYGILIAGLYIPNGNPRPGSKFDYKLESFEPLIQHAADLIATGAPVVLLGEFNVMPIEREVYPERWLQDALFAPEVHALFLRLLDQGWTYALRITHPTRRSAPSGTISGTPTAETPGCA